MVKKKKKATVELAATLLPASMFSLRTRFWFELIKLHRKDLCLAYQLPSSSTAPN